MNKSALISNIFKNEGVRVNIGSLKTTGIVVMPLDISVKAELLTVGATIIDTYLYSVDESKRVWLVKS